LTPEGHVAALFRLAPGRKPAPDGGRQSRFNTRGFALIDLLVSATPRHSAASRRTA
jgi:hypothetical protein